MAVAGRDLAACQPPRGGRSAGTVNHVSAPILVGHAFSDRHEYVGFRDVQTAVAESPDQADIIVRGNVSTSEPIAPTGTYLRLRGTGGYNRSAPSGMPSISAESELDGPLIDLSNLGSKWGSIGEINLFANGIASEGIYTGSSDNGAIRDVSIYAPTDYGIRTGDGAFDMVFDRVLVDGEGTTTTGVFFHGGNEPKMYDSLVRECTSENILIDAVGNVGPRIANTSCRGGGARWGIRIATSGATKNIVIDGCQFENYPRDGAAIAYSPTGDDRSTAHFTISRCFFNKNTNKALETSGKVGAFVLGPWNKFEAEVDLNGTQFSIDPAVCMFNNFSRHLLADSDTARDLTVVEPSLGRFEWANSESLTFGGGSNTATLVTNYQPLDHTGSGVLLPDVAPTALVTVIDETDADVAKVFVAGRDRDVTVVDDPGSAFGASAGEDGRTNVYWSRENGRYEIENRTDASAEYKMIAQQY